MTILDRESLINCLIRKDSDSNIGHYINALRERGEFTQVTAVKSKFEKVVVLPPKQYTKNKKSNYYLPKTTIV